MIWFCTTNPLPPSLLEYACDHCMELTSSTISSEKALGIDLDYNDEMKLGGKATLISSILAGSPAYGQTKVCAVQLEISHIISHFPYT